MELTSHPFIWFKVHACEIELTPELLTRLRARDYIDPGP